MTHAPIGGQDVAVLASRPGDDGETVLRYPAAASGPAVSVLGGTGVTSSWDASTGDLLLDYPHQGVTRIQVAPAGGRPLLLLAVDDTAAGTFWRLDTAAGPVLVSGPALVRTATMRGDVLDLTGDTAAATPLEVWAPRPVAVVFWNGRPVPVTRTASGSLASRNPLSGPPAVDLPALTGWKYAPENPEAGPGFDDSGWTLADKTTSASATPVPAGQPVLFVDDYGFHYGDVWYRGSWSGTAGATSVSLSYQTGQVGMFLAWLDGQFLGAGEIPVPTSSQSTTQGWTATVPLAIPAAGQDDGPHVLAVLVRSMSHQEDGGANQAFKQALGLTAVTFTGATPQLTWRIQGASGGDQARGPMNNGGLYGERTGWYLPDFDDRSWTERYVAERQYPAGRLLVPHSVPAERAARGGCLARPDHHGHAVQVLPGADLPQRLERRAVRQQRRPADDVRAADRAAPAGRGEYAGHRRAGGRQHTRRAGRGDAGQPGHGGRRGAGPPGPGAGPLSTRIPG